MVAASRLPRPGLAASPPAMDLALTFRDLRLFYLRHALVAEGAPVDWEGEFLRLWPGG